MRITKENIKSLNKILVFDTDEDFEFQDDSAISNDRNDEEDDKEVSSIAKRIFGKEKQAAPEFIKKIPHVKFQSSKGIIHIFRDWSFVYDDLQTNHSFYGSSITEYSVTDNVKNKIHYTIYKKVKSFLPLLSLRYSPEFRKAVFEGKFASLNHFLSKCGVHNDSGGFLCSCPRENLAELNYTENCGIAHVAYKKGMNDAIKSIAGLKAKLLFKADYKNYHIKVFKDISCFIYDDLVQNSMEINKDVYEFIKKCQSTNKFEFHKMPELLDFLDYLSFRVAGGKKRKPVLTLKQ